MVRTEARGCPLLVPINRRPPGHLKTSTRQRGQAKNVRAGATHGVTPLRRTRGQGQVEQEGECSVIFRSVCGSALTCWRSTLLRSIVVSFRLGEPLFGTEAKEWARSVLHLP